MQVEFAKLREVAIAVASYAPKQLTDPLWDALDDLEAAAKAKKAIACDNAIAIIKQIKALKAW